MCGIVGLHLLDDELQPQMGHLLAAMLTQMTDRGPDSAGVAVYGDTVAGDMRKYSCRASGPLDWEALAASLDAKVARYGDGVVFVGAPGLGPQIEAAGVRIVSTGRSVEVFKETGLPGTVLDRFQDRVAYRLSRRRPHPPGHRIGDYHRWLPPVLDPRRSVRGP